LTNSTTSTTPNGDSRLTLAYMYHPRSFETMALVEAAAGVCELLWIVDTSNDEVSSMSRLLRRLGTVIDIAGLSVDDSSALIVAANPDGILALADDLLETTASIATRLELPFFSPETANLLTDKLAQRHAFEEAGIETPTVVSIQIPTSQRDVDDMIDRVRLPLVLKPRKGESSRNTYLVETVDELRVSLAELSEVNEVASRQFIVESYIPDALESVAGAGFAGYVSVESIVSAGIVSHLAITGRTPMAEPLRETSAFIPGDLSPLDQAAVLELATRAVKAMKVSIGCVDTEIKLTPDGPRIIEVNGRIGGHVPFTLSSATGISILPLAMRVALGDDIVIAALPQCQQVGYVLHYFAPRNVRAITSVSGLERLRERPGVEEVILLRGAGRAVDWHEGSFGHVFSVAGAVPGHDDLRELLRAIADTVVIDGE
jgi:biotin carboxylase